MIDSNEQDGLWNLLGRASQPPISPFFSRNVLRAVRQAPASFPWVAIPRWATVASLAVVVFGFGATLADTSRNSQKAFAGAQEQPLFDHIAGIHDLASIEPIGPEEFAGL